jgi:hypothetical protein
MIFAAAGIPTSRKTGETWGTRESPLLAQLRARELALSEVEGWGTRSEIHWQLATDNWPLELTFCSN